MNVTQISPIVDPAVLDARDKLQSVLDDVATIAIERDEAIATIGLAMVSESNLFMAGLPGVAKSMVFGEILARVGEAKTGFFTVTKGSTPETLVGPISIRALEEDDVIRHNTTGMLPDVHYAYITEVFKGNSLTRNAALQVLNERVFFNGGIIQYCPLLMCVADSNEYPDSREEAAFWDRFLVRLQVEPVADFGKRMRMVHGSLKRGRGFAKPNPMINLSDIKILMDARKDIEFTDQVEESALMLLNGLHTEDIKIGDRRFCDTFNLAAANAIMKGRKTLTPDDLQVFRHTAWSNPDDHKRVRLAVLRILSPELADITKMLDEVEDAFDIFRTKKKEADESKNIKLAMAANQEFGDAAENHWRAIGLSILKMQKNNQDAAEAIDMRRRIKSRIEEASKMAMRRSMVDDDDLIGVA